MGIHKLIRKTADFFQSDESRSVCIVDEVKTVADYKAVFTRKADNIGNGRNSGKVAELFKRHSIVAVVERRNKLHCDHGAA